MPKQSNKTKKRSSAAKTKQAMDLDAIKGSAGDNLPAKSTKEKKRDTDKIINEPDDLPQNTLDIVLADTLDIERTDKDSLRIAKLVTYMDLGHSAHKAAVMAGYSESYATSGVYNLIKNTKKYRKIREKFIKNAAACFKKSESLLLGDLAEVESKVLDLLKEKPELALKHPSLLRQIKVGAKVLQEEPGPGSTLINVDKAMVLMRDGDRKTNRSDD